MLTRAIAILLAVALPSAWTAGQDKGREEQDLIQVLLSDRPAVEKGDACRRLKQIGTEKSVPALAACLANEELSHAARQALESMPCEEAGKALCDALGKTTGLTRAGIIDSIGLRRERQAVPALAALLSDPDAAVAAAAARSLGRMGGLDCLDPLRLAWPKSSGTTRPVILDALLRCADLFRMDGKDEVAAAICRELYESKEAEHVRVGAYRGLALASGDRQLGLIVAGIKGDDPAARLAGLGLAAEVKGAQATEALASLLRETPPAVQAALVKAMAQRGDPAALSAVAAMVKSPEPAVRIAALGAIGDLGDASAVPLLAETAAGARDAEQDAARQALACLRRGDVRRAMDDLMAQAPAPVQVELVRALTARHDRQAVPLLLKKAEGPDEQVQAAALQAVSVLGDETLAAPLVELLTKAKSGAAREAAERALVAIAGQPKPSPAMGDAVLAAMQGADPPARCSLLRVAGRIGGPKAMDALRAAANDPIPEIRDTAVRALAGSAGVEALPDLLALAREAPNPTHRVLALRGYWRVVGLAANRPYDERLKRCKDGLALSQQPDEKRLALAELAKLPGSGSLELAEPLRADADVRAEADLACYQVAAQILLTRRTEAEAALRRLASDAADKVRADAGTLVKSLDEHADYIAPWLVAGPYREQGKQAQQLFDVVFPPEQPDAAKVEWRPLPAPADPALFWQADLSGVVGGNHCVAYLSTQVYVPKDEAAVLEIGSDDGVKLWLNGDLVHANNAVRGLTPGQDKAQARLRQGWNRIFAKVTQHTAGCALCLRIRAADGSAIEGLRVDPTAAPIARSRFTRIVLTPHFWSEGAWHGDYNRDGKPDVTAGPFWYEGPDFQKRHEFRPATASFKRKRPDGTEETISGYKGALSNENAYSDDFFTFGADFDGDGWDDILVIGIPGGPAFWFKNPGPQQGAGEPPPWARYKVFDVVENESPCFGDITGDGKPEIVCNSGGFLGYITFNWKSPAEPGAFHAISPKGKWHKFTHGMGLGDVNGDGRMDLLEQNGWWEQPKSLESDPLWVNHPFPFSPSAAQIYAYDFNGDGLNDVLTCLNAHGYGLAWYEQFREGAEIKFKPHIIMSPENGWDRHGVAFSEPHAIELVDMDRDGVLDVLVGKRFWAHGPKGDIEPNAPAVVYWFKTVRGPDGSVDFLPNLIDDDSGVGTQVAYADLNGDGLPDVIVGNKKGAFVFLQQK